MRGILHARQAVQTRHACVPKLPCEALRGGTRGGACAARSGGGRAARQREGRRRAPVAAGEGAPCPNLTLTKKATLCPDLTLNISQPLTRKAGSPVQLVPSPAQ